MDPRTHSLVRGVSASVLGRAVGAIGPVLMVPITLGYLGSETFGFWMALTSLTAMVVWADLGLGNGLLTRLSRDAALDDATDARRSLSSAYATLSIVALALIAVLAVVAEVVPWNSLLNAEAVDLTAPPAKIALVCLGTFLINIPLSLVQRAQYAYDRVAQSNILQAAGVLVALTVTWILTLVDAGPIAVIAGAVSGPVLGSIFNSFGFYCGAGRRLIPRWSYTSRATSASLLRMGSRFLALSMLTAAALNIDNLIVAHTLGLDTVAEYAVAFRLFSTLGMLINLVNLPLWPANAAALARGEHDWVRRTTRRMIVISATAVAIPGSVITAVGPDIVMPLLGATESTPRSLFLTMTIWWTLVAGASPLFMVQNARAVLGPQAIGWLAYLALSIPIKVAAGTAVGLTGIPAAGAAIYACCVVTGAVVGYRRALSPERPTVGTRKNDPVKPAIGDERGWIA